MASPHNLASNGTEKVGAVTTVAEDMARAELLLSSTKLMNLEVDACQKEASCVSYYYKVANLIYNYFPFAGQPRWKERKYFWKS